MNQFSPLRNQRNYIFLLFLPLFKCVQSLQVHFIFPVYPFEANTYHNIIINTVNDKNWLKESKLQFINIITVSVNSSHHICVMAKNHAIIFSGKIEKKIAHRYTYINTSHGTMSQCYFQVLFWIIYKLHNVVVFLST